MAKYRIGTKFYRMGVLSQVGDEVEVPDDWKVHSSWVKLDDAKPEVARAPEPKKADTKRPSDRDVA
jgi:hypothetical protein